MPSLPRATSLQRAVADNNKSIGDLVDKLDSIKDAAVKSMVASIVWWDLFSNRHVSERIAEFDKFLRNPDIRRHIMRVDRDSVVEALIKIGYDSTKASDRVFFSLMPDEKVGKKSNRLARKSDHKFDEDTIHLI